MNELEIFVEGDLCYADLGCYGSKANTTTRQVILNYRSFKFLVVLRHEKHPKGWIGVQLLGADQAMLF